MPKRKIVKLSEEAIDAIKQARARGIPFTEEEAKSISSSVYHLSYPELPRNVTSDIGYDGQRRYWSDGKKGPGSLEPPNVGQVQEMERDHLTVMAKAKRRPPILAAAKARIALSKRGAIQQAWREMGLDTPHAAKQIAHRLKVSAAYVRKVGAEMRLSERTP